MQIEYAPRTYALPGGLGENHGIISFPKSLVSSQFQTGAEGKAACILAAYPAQNAKNGAPRTYFIRREDRLTHHHPHLFFPYERWLRFETSAWGHEIPGFAVGFEAAADAAAS